MGLMDLLLNKGGAGVSLSRRETAERLDPIIRRHYELLHAYEYLRRYDTDPAVGTQVAAWQRTLRTDIGKLAETVLSSGLAPYTGTDLEPGSVRLGDDPRAMRSRLAELEDGVHRLLADELKADHQIRTRAVLTALHANSRDRLAALRGDRRGR